jgi:hypothetical protein
LFFQRSRFPQGGIADLIHIRGFHYLQYASVEKRLSTLPQHIYFSHPA